MPRPTMIPRAPRDIEEGMPNEERRVNHSSRRAFSNQCVCGKTTPTDSFLIEDVHFTGLALLLLFLRYPLITVVSLFLLQTFQGYEL